MHHNSAMLAVSEPACAVGSSAVGAAVAAALQFFAASQCVLRPSWPEADELQDGSRFDFIVVGGGTAGAVLASRLAEQNVTVLLVEAGGDPPEESIIPGFRDYLKGSRYDWNFTTTNDNYSSQSLSYGRQKQPRGKVLGGTGAINDMIYARGYPKDYDEWATIVGQEWNWTTVLDYFKKTEHMTDERIIDDPELMSFHGRNGEIEVSGQKNTSYETQKFLEAFEELGFNIVKDMTYPLKFGAGRFSHTIRNGHRESSATAFLKKGELRKLSILKDSLVTKILIDNINKSAFGVQVETKNRTMQLYADSEVILSAGTFNTAKLLLLSGIGPKEHLENLGIDVIQDLPVGENYHDHVMVLTYLAVEKGTCTTEKPVQYMETIKYLYDRSGSLSKSDSMGAYLSLHGSSHPDVPDFAIYPVCIPVASDFLEGCTHILGFKEHICATIDAKNKEQELLSLAVVLLKPASRGSVKLNPTNHLEAPIIYSGTFQDPQDLKGYPEAIEMAYSIANTTYFRGKSAQVIKLDIEGCDEMEGVDSMKCYARSMATSAWHAVGTAAMGSVVDSRLRVKGVGALRVVDASVMPKVIRGNTNAPVVMIAERAAEFIKEDLIKLDN